jgi:hypothetical protein
MMLNASVRKANKEDNITQTAMLFMLEMHPKKKKLLVPPEELVSIIDAGSSLLVENTSLRRLSNSFE